MLKIIKITFIIIILCGNCVVSAADASRDQILDLYGYIYWQQINSVRNNPAAYLDELGITRQQAEAALGDTAWVLDDGLAPLAWNDTLSFTANQHGRDMMSNFYYDKVSLNGLDPAMRVAASSYDAVNVSESLGVIAFNNYIEIGEAVKLLVDIMLKDEFSGNYAADINILSPNLTEVGISVLAEELELVPGLTYVYLAVLDFATPQLMNNFVIASTFDDSVVTFLDLATSATTQLIPLSPGSYQFPVPLQGGVIVARDSNQSLLAWRFVPSQPADKNYYIDLH